jgi:AAA15 family ATPase/GTPase
MVDEIESGFHYSVVKDVWTAVGKLAREANVQVFAATHSWECLKAAHGAFSECKNYDFRLHRLDRMDGETTSSTYDGQMLSTALESGTELR